MSEMEPRLQERTPRQLFDEVVEASHYSKYAFGHEPSPALAVYKETKSIPEGINLIKGLADFIAETSPDIDEGQALDQALQAIDTIGANDKPWGYALTSGRMRIHESKIGMWRQVAEFFRLEAEAQAQLNG